MRRKLESAASNRRDEQFRITARQFTIARRLERSMKASHTRDLGGLSIVRLGKTDWRVSSGEGGEELLGYIERQRGGRFEVVWMTDPMRWGYAASFDEAILAFGDSVRFTGEVLDDRAAVVGSPRSPAVTPARRTTWLKSTGRSSVA
jgi:hypothetical protein